MKRNLLKLFLALFMLSFIPLLPLKSAQAAPGDFLFQWGKPYLLMYPRAVAVDASGKMYVTDSSNIKVIDRNGVLISTWGSFGSGNAQFAGTPPALKIRGNRVYVADSGNNRIQVLNKKGEFITSWGGPGSADGLFDGPAGIAISDSGYVYVADYLNHRIQIFDLNGNFISAFGASGGINPATFFPEDVAVGKNGNLYVISMYSIHVFDSMGTFINTWDFGADWVPQHLAIDCAGNVYVNVLWWEAFDTYGPELVEVFDSNGKLLRKWGGFGRGPGTFFGLDGIALDDRQRVYVVDYYNKRVEIFENSGKYIRQIGGVNAPGQFRYPEGTATDTDGNVYVVDSYNDRIQVFDMHGHFLRQFGSAGTGPGDLTNPHDIAVDRDGNAYVSDTGAVFEPGRQDDRILVFDKRGNFVRSWPVFPEARGPAGIAVDDSGNVYLADSWNDHVAVFDRYGAVVRSIGSRGSGIGQFLDPADVAVDSSGNLYVTDMGNHRIQVFSKDGTFLRTWGGEGTGDGQFGYPGSIAIDGAGNVYVTDLRSNSAEDTIKVFDTAGNFLGKWGSYGSGDGQFIVPGSLAASPSGGIVYVVDSSNERMEAFEGFGDMVPGPWIGRDIGSVGIPGHAGYRRGIFTIKGSGGGIGGTADGFHFVYLPLSGDGEIVARVTPMDDGSGAKAGVMIRASLEADSADAMLAIAQNGRSEFSARLTTGGPASVRMVKPVPARVWLKLVRRGNTISAYTSYNGRMWKTAGAATVVMDSTAYIGLAVTSGDSAVLSTAIFNHVSAK